MACKKSSLIQTQNPQEMLFTASNSDTSSSSAHVSSAGLLQIAERRPPYHRPLIHRTRYHITANHALLCSSSAPSKRLTLHTSTHGLYTHRPPPVTTRPPPTAVVDPGRTSMIIPTRVALFPTAPWHAHAAAHHPVQDESHAIRRAGMLRSKPRPSL